MKNWIAFLTIVATVATGLSCAKPQGARKYHIGNKHEINFELPGQKKYIVESYADRVGFDWRITLTIHNLDVADISAAALKQGAYPVSFSGEKNKSIIKWEFPTDRWDDRTPFELRVDVGNEGAKYIDVTVRHRLKSTARETALGAVIISAAVGLRLIF